MSKTPTKQSNPTRKAKPTPDTSVNDAARSEALAKLKAASAANAPQPSSSKPSTTRSACAEPATGSQPKPRAKPRGKDASKRLSALDAAAQVLRALSPKDARLGLSASELIDRMAAAGLWTSPSGQTPAATLYAAMIREVTSKGDAARFVRLEGADGGKRGRFTTSSVAASATRKDQTSKLPTQKSPKPQSRKGAA